MLPQLPVSVQSAASALLEWVDQQHTLPSQPNLSNSRAVRAHVRVHPGRNAPLSWLRAHHFPQKLFFRSREQSFEVAALGFAHVATGPVFTEHVQQSLVSVLNPKHPEMRFYGGCRFDPSPQSRRDDEWQPFNGFTFVLPALELCRDCHGQFSLAVNYYPPAGAMLFQRLLRQITATPLSLQTLEPSFMIPSAHTITDLTDFSTWDSAMSIILSQLSSNQYEKIVLARRKRFSFPSASAPDPIHVIAALEQQNQEKATATSHVGQGQTHSPTRKSKADAAITTYLFCLQLDHNKAFVGCTPERLFYLKDKSIWTEALAGTVRRSSDGNEGEVLSVLWSEKNLEEHRFVVDYIRTALSDSGVSVETNGPHVRRLPRLMHLATHIHGEIKNNPLKDNHNVGSNVSHAPKIFRILETMHPTPAVCGMPRERAFDEIRRLEDFDRGFFAGPLGWFSSDSAEFCVAIRSALIHGSNVTAFAGSGIVQASESQSEWEETELKMSAFTDLFTVRQRKKWLQTNPVLQGFHLSPSTSPRSFVPNRINDDIRRQHEPFLPNGEFAHDFSRLTTPALSTLSEGGKSIQSVGNLPSRSPSASSPGSMKTVGTTTLPSHCGEEDSFFDPSQIERMPNLNALWGSCCIEELCRNGVKTFFVAPGSRSAPLAVGVARSCHAELYVAHDERGAGFLAVGYARGSKRAAAIITSSGTAVANLLPAVVEASMDSLPIILLTADRPPELRDIGANQAIYQPGIFGEYVRWSKDMPCPSSEVPLRNLLSDINYAVYMSGSSRDANNCFPTGPVHINMMFREKLAPDHQPWDRSCISSIPSRWQSSFNPLITYAQSVDEGVSVRRCVGRFDTTAWYWSRENSVISTLTSKTAGLILVGGATGAAQTENDALALYEIARLLEWPIISDVCGGLRFDASSRDMVHYADQIYGSELVRQGLRPDCVLQFGERITSKRIQKLIEYASNQCEDFVHVLVSSSTKRADPFLTVTHRISSDIGGVLREVQALKKAEITQGGMSEMRISPQERTCQKHGSQLRYLPTLSRRIDTVLQGMLAGDENEQLTEPWCARVLSECLKRPSCLFIGNSMAIRDLDAFAGYAENGIDVKVAANRGASGIDGILSSGIGFGIGLNMDVTVILGDMSMIHDLNALHLLRTEVNWTQIRVTIVVVNNGGGGIFSMLPIAKHRDVFSPIFDTPHGVEFSKVCDMFGIEYCTARTPGELRTALRNSNERHRVIEAVVVTDHASNAALHQRLSANVAQQVSAALADKN